MAVTVKHKFVSQKADSVDPSVIRPSNWNDTHALRAWGPSLLGRATAGDGDVQEINIGTGLVLSGNVLSAAAQSTNAATLGGQAPAYYTNIPARLGFTPVRSDNPGRLSLHWADAGAPYMGVDNTYQRLTLHAEHIAFANVANSAAAAANAANANALAAFTTLRLTGGTNTGSVSHVLVPSGGVVVGYARENGGSGQVNFLHYKFLQGFSPSRGWIGAYNEG